MLPLCVVLWHGHIFLVLQLCLTTRVKFPWRPVTEDTCMLFWRWVSFWEDGNLGDKWSEIKDLEFINIHKLNKFAFDGRHIKIESIDFLLQPIDFSLADGLFSSKVDIQGWKIEGTHGKTELTAQIMTYFSLNPHIITLQIRCETFMEYVITESDSIVSAKTVNEIYKTSSYVFNRISNYVRSRALQII